VPGRCAICAGPGVSCEDRPTKRSRRSTAALSEQEASIDGTSRINSRRLYVDALGLALTAEDDGYLHSEDIDGCKSFGVWPLTQAAQACFGTPDWPVERPVPQASVEFEVADAETVQVAADELKGMGFTLLHDARTEPWGQTVARLQSSEGAIIGISYAPSMH
jgi:catechol 2,3-dioxygenase-like lactoylglutathione lyase family enzyme